MTTRIPFTVIFASDEELDHPSSELNVHNPTIHGWRSQRDSKISPKEILLKFDMPAKVCRIQVLTHQYIIPQKIEFWMLYLPNSTADIPINDHFEYLGFISISDNSSTNYKSRQLQSVSVGPKIGTHLKLRFGEPHVNQLNLYNQVALVAGNVIGIGEIGTENVDANSPVGEINDTLQSICDDLSFSMYVEQTTAGIIREMEIKKGKAILDERFEYARKLKLCMGALRTAGERLGRYALAKRQAVQQEDFITATLRKEQIEMYRNAVYQELQVEQLMERDSITAENDALSKVYTQKPNLPSAPSLQEVAFTLSENKVPMKSSHSDIPATNTSNTTTTNTPSTDEQITSSRNGQIDGFSSPQLHQLYRSPSRGSPTTNTGSLRRRNKSAPRNSYEDYEERAVPALRHSHTNEFLRECQGSAICSENDHFRGRSKLNEREKRQAALPILVFGYELVELFYSRQFQDREDGLSRLRTILKDQKAEVCQTTINKTARSATLLLHRAIRDAVFSVFSQATETVRALFVNFAPNRVSPSEIARCVDRLLPELLAKSGDPSSRIHTLAQHTILSIAACPEVRQQHLVAPALSRNVGSGTHPRLALSRVQMLEQLVLSQGISTDKQSGLTCRVLSECGSSGIHHQAEAVRKVAERILLLVYRVNPRLVRKQLPPDDDVTRRNLLYRQLFTEFDKIDLQRHKQMLKSNADPVTSSLNGTLGRSKKATDQSPNCATGSKYIVSNGLAKKKSRNLSQNSNSDDDGAERNKSKVNADNQVESQIEKQCCPFCDWIYVGDASQLDKHFWKSCPILIKCWECDQVLEVSALNTHLANECDARKNYVQCGRCTETVEQESYEIHVSNEYCTEPKASTERCLLCHKDIDSSIENAWKIHLLQPNGCIKHARRPSKI